MASNDDDGVSRDSFLRYVATANGTYYAVVGNWVPTAPNEAGNLPVDPGTPGTGRGVPGGAVDDYEAVLLLDGAAYFTHTAPGFPLIGPDETAQGSVTLRNEGASTPIITALTFSGPGSAAYSVSETLPINVAPGASREIALSFNPGGSTKAQEAVLEVVSNDIVHPTLELTLHATSVGPTAANSAPNCFGTNLDADYAIDANVWLRSPVIDLTNVGEATLHYFNFVEIEAAFDFGRVAVLNASDDSELAEVAFPVDGVGAGWKKSSHAIPAEALGKLIKLEFRFQADNFNNLAGWYIDDVTVTAP